jgi:hypothetical protein
MLLLDVLSVVLVITILMIIIGYLININKKLNARIQQEKNRFILYKDKLHEISEKDVLTKKDLEAISKLARDFFKERFNLSYTLSYIEMSEIFRKDEFDERVSFCDRMSQLLYAGEKIDTKDIKDLIAILLIIIENYKYM